jgi:hypothetical protein
MRDLALFCHDTPVIANEVKQSIDLEGLLMGMKKLRSFDDICDVGMQTGVCIPTRESGNELSSQIPWMRLIISRRKIL